MVSYLIEEILFIDVNWESSSQVKVEHKSKNQEAPAGKDQQCSELVSGMAYPNLKRLKESIARPALPKKWINLASPN